MAYYGNPYQPTRTKGWQTEWKYEQKQAGHDRQWWRLIGFCSNIWKGHQKPLVLACFCTWNTPLKGEFWACPSLQNTWREHHQITVGAMNKMTMKGCWVVNLRCKITIKWEGRGASVGFKKQHPFWHEPLVFGVFGILNITFKWLPSGNQMSQWNIHHV